MRMRFGKERQRLNRVILIGLSCLTPTVAFSVESLYSDLSDKVCRVIQRAEEGEGDWVKRECPGVLGYKIQKDTDDARDSLTILQGNQKQPLDFWGRVTGYFNHLGDKAEWRVRDGKVIALIVRMYFTDLETNKKEQRLIVIKVRLSESCVTQVINASRIPNANEKAREAADHAAEAKCLWN
ncbi:MAG: hypothetical protein HYZ73_08415 [Elusimicrobia bacterium]|nr:hypothetical protein [Elusimicrobiota bacterium]